jgi:hypothetical protein
MRLPRVCKLHIITSYMLHIDLTCPYI